MEEFQYLGVSFTSEGKMGCEIERWVGYAIGVLDHLGEERDELRGKTLDLLRSRRSSSKLWLRTLGSGQKDTIENTAKMILLHGVDGS